MENKNEAEHYNLYYIIKEKFEEKQKCFDFCSVMLDYVMKVIENRGCDDYGQNNADNNCESGTDRG